MNPNLSNLKEQVFEANLELVKQGLVTSTFGNASGLLAEENLAVIKPSGVDYGELTPEMLVVTDLHGNIVEGKLRPSSDLPTHLVLYRSFPGIGGAVHTHSRYATAWAQAGREIPCLGTTHADYFHGPVPLTDWMTEEEIADAYEENTGHVIVRRFSKIDPRSFPSVLVAGHGPFCWGKDVSDAVHHAVLLEEIARIAQLTVSLNPGVQPIPKALLDKHFLRKHGPGAYYGQKK
jgi:L-ribulose-5-phosphate 4-epimerase